MKLSWVFGANTGSLISSGDQSQFLLSVPIVTSYIKPYFHPKHSLLAHAWGHPLSLLGLQALADHLLDSKLMLGRPLASCKDVVGLLLR